MIDFKLGPIVSVTASEGPHVVLWLSSYETWEKDYLRELFPSINNNESTTSKFSLNPSLHFVHVTQQEFMSKYGSAGISSSQKDLWPRVLVYNVENSGNEGKYVIVREFVEKYKPAMLVHLSDEFQGWAKKWKYGEGVEVYHLVPYVLREYSVKPYVSYATPRSNVIQIPLGYMRNMLQTEDGQPCPSIEMLEISRKKKSQDRNLTWSFIGEIRAHRDRYIALNIFSSWKPHVIEAGLKPHEVKDIYSNSLFVLVGRGQMSLDCLRVYEAIIAGAIPIVVGGKDEVLWTFDFEGDHPPLLIADSYEEALVICRNMTFSDIDQRRDELAQWYSSRISLIKRRVEYAIRRYPV